MQTGLLAVVLAYFFISIIGIGWLVSKKQKSDDSFLLASRSLNWQVLSITLALSILGTPHIFGLFEMSYFMGAVSMWFSFACTLVLIVLCIWTGPWVRKLNVSSVPEMLYILFGKKTRLLMVCVMIPAIWGITTCELQGMGITFSLLTGMSIEHASILGGFLGILYVSMAGLQEVAWLNVVNAAVKYLGLVVAAVFVTMKLPHGWAGVSQYYIDQDQPWMLSIWGTPELFWSFAMGTVVAILIVHSLGQQLCQPAMGAKDVGTLRKCLWPAVFINGLLAIFSVTFGMAAKSVPQFSALGPKMAAITMLLEYLPGFAIALLLCAIFGSMLSSFSATILASATLYTKDIHSYLANGPVSPAEEKKVARMAIIILVIIAAIVATAMPPIVLALNWLFSWYAPMVVMILIGLFWKRNETVAVITFLAGWAVNIIWSFTDVAGMLGLEAFKFSNVYPVLLISLVVGIVLTSIMDGKQAYFAKENQSCIAKSA